MLAYLRPCGACGCRAKAEHPETSQIRLNRKSMSMLLKLTLLDGRPIGVSLRFLAYVVPNGTGARLTFGDGSSADVAETFEHVLSAAAAAKKEKAPAA